MESLTPRNFDGTVPDIAGFTFGEARRKLMDAGVEIASVVVTGPPRNCPGELNDDYRVIRWTRVGVGKIEILVCKPL